MGLGAEANLGDSVITTKLDSAINWVEIIFMFPWAVNILELGFAGIIKMFIFIGLLFAGLIYMYKKKALSWD